MRLTLRQKILVILVTAQLILAGLGQLLKAVVSANSWWYHVGSTICERGWVGTAFCCALAIAYLFGTYCRRSRVTITPLLLIIASLLISFGVIIYLMVVAECEISSDYKLYPLFIGAPTAIALFIAALFMGGKQNGD